MPKQREFPCNPALDDELERLFAPEGQSIKSALKLSSSPSTDPTALNGTEIRIQSSKLILGLVESEIQAVRGFYIWRAIADRLSAVARQARQNARGYRRRRAFRSGIKEIERRWSERRKNKAPR